MRKTMLAVLLAGGFIGSSYATDARVIAMGRHDDFFHDETSIVRNPADIGMYPSMLEGSLGAYRLFKGDSSTAATLRDPVDPYFGATFVYPVSSASPEESTKFALGALFNRHDPMLDYLSPQRAGYVGNHNDLIPDPAGKIDLFLGCALRDGPLIGIGAYLASQSYISGTVIDSEASVYKLNVGINWPLGRDTRLEISGSGGILRGKGDSAGAGLQRVIVAYDDRFYSTDGRLFLGIGSLKGSLVPQVHYQSVNLYSGRVTLTDFSAGLGYNRPLNKGLFWAGLQYVSTSGSYFSDSTGTGTGGKVSFGLEHAVWGDWLLLRAGGQKMLLYRSDQSKGNPIKKQWYENAESDGSDNDCLGLGLGIVSGKRLHIDFVLSEDIPFTIANLLGGPEQYLFSRISATYGF